MCPHAGASLSRRRFLSLPAGGAAAGAVALNGCALQVPSGVSGPGETTGNPPDPVRGAGAIDAPFFGRGT